MEAISRSCLPAAAARTKRQRKATCCGVLGAASHRTTCSRSSAAKLTSGLILAMRTHISYWPQYVYLFMIHTTSLRPLIAHTSAMNAADLKTLAPERLEEVDLVVTSYGSLLRMPWIAEASWQLVVLDEAQAIKNPDAKQTRAAKKLKAKSRFALTGTPIENRLGDLWSIFDFLNPGLLGSAKEFTRFTKHLAERPYNPYAPLRELLPPSIPRRLKTDKTAISNPTVN